MKTLYYATLTFFCSLTLSAALRAQDIHEIENDSLPLDSGVRVGELPNGFRYYIKPMDEPQERLFMRLIVKVGSNHEEKSELDMAHAIEHLAFNPSNNFSVNFLNNPRLKTELGMQQQNIFAQTGWNYTAYFFDPASEHSLEGEKVGLQFFRTIASDIELSDQEVEEEKGVLRQEVPYRIDNLLEWYIEFELESKLFPCRNDVSDFFGLNRKMTAEGLRGFYKKWYRPNRMAIIIVGNIDDPKRLEKDIAATFSDLENPLNRVDEKECQKKYFGRPPQFVRLNRKLSELSPVEDSRVEFQLIYRDTITREKIATWEGIKREYLWSLVTKLIEKKFQNKNSRHQDFRKLLAHYAYDRHPSALKLTIISTKDQEREVLSKVIGVIKDLKGNGISAKELEDLKKEHSGALIRKVSEDAEYWNNGLKNNFVYDKALPEDRERKLEKWFQELSLQEFKEIMDEMLRIMPEDIGIIAPSGHYINGLLESEIRQWIFEANSDNSRETEHLKVPEMLLTEETKASLIPAVFQEKRAGELGIHEVKLDNGVSVFLKPITPSPGKDHDKIVIHGFRPKGALCFSEEDYFSAINAPDIVKFTGVGGFDRYQLNGFLEGTSFRQGLFPYINNLETGIKGKAKFEDFEELLQLIYLYFSSPLKDSMAYKAWKEKEIVDYLIPTGSTILADFSNGIQAELGNKNHVPLGTRRIQGLKDTEFDRSFEIYEKLFKKPSEFTFIITGDFSFQKIMPMIQKYLGNIPDSNKIIECKQQVAQVQEHQNPFLKRIPVPDHYIMESDEYRLQFIAKQEGMFNWREYVLSKTLGYYLNQKLKELRFKKGAALYKMFAGTVYEDESLQYFYYISLDAIPEEVDWLRKECKKMIREIQNGSIDSDIFKEIKVNVLERLYDSNYLNRNDQVSERLYRNIRFGVPLLNESEAERIIESITPADIQEIARKHLTDSNMYEFIMGKGAME